MRKNNSLWNDRGISLQMEDGIQHHSCRNLSVNSKRTPYSTNKWGTSYYEKQLEPQAAVNTGRSRRSATKILSIKSKKGEWMSKEMSLRCPQVIAGIGEFRDTLTSRTISALNSLFNANWEKLVLYSWLKFWIFGKSLLPTVPNRFCYEMLKRNFE